LQQRSIRVANKISIGARQHLSIAATGGSQQEKNNTSSSASPSKQHQFHHHSKVLAAHVPMISKDRYFVGSNDGVSSSLLVVISNASKKG